MSTVNKNENKIMFKALFMEVLRTAEPGAVITDSTLKDISTAHGLGLSLPDIQGCIRQLEYIIGDRYQIRAVRIQKEGYKIYAGEEQYFKASAEGRSKLVGVVKKTSKRINAIDLAKLPQDLKASASSKKMALDSLLNIVKGVMTRHNLEVKDVNVLSSAANELKALEHLKRSGF